MYICDSCNSHIINIRYVGGGYHVGFKELSRHIATVKTFDGSKGYDQFMDIGVEGWYAFVRCIHFHRTHLCVSPPYILYRATSN